ncbi:MULTISPECIES: hypothetical protein [Acidithiobacillus]|jgi:hypothetical protein|uniref:hypothetical protein n=1 Tax=Acidithiobacillus TaxID=119977 RepID=UPI00068BC2CE|nr:MULTISPECIES: hypothetical protein [Acidithiobacillus]MDA8177445.1 hypothetical protein [Acidithiobacillus sp.]
MVKLTQNNLRGPGPGRPKGSTNKITGSVKELIIGALEQAGGVGWLAKQATENPVAFMALLGKLLPSDLQVSGANGAPIMSISAQAVATPEEIRRLLREERESGESLA